MARMKFLCDAERCIECNGCVTACKNANEVPWGVNRRRVVTLNDGEPGDARSRWRACMLRCAVHGGVPGRLLLQDRGRHRPSRQGSVHRLRLLLLCLPVRRAAISAKRRLRHARQDGQVHLLRRRPGRRTSRKRSSRSTARTASRRGSSRMRGNVLDQGVCSAATAM